MAPNQEEVRGWIARLQARAMRVASTIRQHEICLDDARRELDETNQLIDGLREMLVDIRELKPTVEKWMER